MTRTSPPIVPTTFHDALHAIQCASSPAALFGQRAGIDPDGAHQRAATRLYHHVARLVHPDRAPSAHAADAQAAFVRLGQLWEQYQRHPAEPARSTVRGGGRVYTVGAELGHSQIADLHRATYRNRDGRRVRVVLKTSRSAAADEAMLRESAALRRLAAAHKASQLPYVPHLVDSFQVPAAGPAAPGPEPGTATGPGRTTNVLAPMPGFHSLSKISAAYPGGLDALDLVWVWRALLVGLGQAHRAGVVHGAVVPDHVLVRPRDRSLMLVEWSSAVVDAHRSRRLWNSARSVATAMWSPTSAPASAPETAATTSTTSVPATATAPTPNRDCAPALPSPPLGVQRFAEFYPPGGAGSAGWPSEAADVHMATRCMTSLFRDDTPLPLLQFAQGCLLPARSRQRGVWQLLGEFDELVDRMYGPRHARPFRRCEIQLDGQRT